MGWSSGQEFPINSCPGLTGTPARLVPWSNRTGNEPGEPPHYHRAVPDPARPGNCLPGSGMRIHRPWEGGF